MIRAAKPFHPAAALAAALALSGLACSGEDGSPGADGRTVVARTADVAPGAGCASGGVRVEVGVDDDRDGALGDLEVDSTVLVCDGADGRSVVPSLEDPGANCPYGGVRLDSGAAPATYVCSGAPGEVGPAGESVTVTPEPAGAACAYGGQRLQVGGGTATYVCDGAPGEAGAAGESVAMTPEPAGGACEFGGQRLQVGSGDPAWVCNGAPGADGESVTMTPEPPGEHCEFGGVALQVGTGPATYLCNGQPAGATLPVVDTAAVTAVRYVDAAVSGTVVDDGNELVLARGVVLSTAPAPTLRDAVHFSADTSAAFSTRCDGLAPATTYFVRAFATNALGTSYGAELSFTTLPLGPPTLSTRDVSNVTTTTAISGGDVGDDGGTEVLSRGICWSTAAEPTLADVCVSEGVGAGTFLALATGLAPDTLYHLRAWATNAQGTGWGEDRTFVTAALPLAAVTTAAASAVSYTTATAGGTVLADNGAPVTSRGICWGTAPGPTTAGATYVENGGLGAFTAAMSGLAPATTYYVRAFAVNGAGTSYGNEVSFTTLAPTIPSIATKGVSGISSDLAGSGGVIATDGGSPITAKGVCWSLNPNPTTANARTTDGTGAASFNSTMAGLAPLTTYHVRAYATNALGTAYGNDVSFTTTDLVTPGPGVPIVGTATSLITGSSTASSGGYVSSDGGSPVTARGVCWSPSPGPTLADTCSSDGTGVGFFTSTVTGLSGCGIRYYVRAYATNSTGTGYGNENSVGTGLLPTVATSPVTDVGYYGATAGGSVTDDGGCAITQKGVVWSWSPNPVLGNFGTSDGTGTAPYVSTLSALYANRTYYVRAYATNSVGTSYGGQEVFTTLEPAGPYVGRSYAGGIVFYVDGTGEHGLVVAPSDQGSYPWGCRGTSIPTSHAVGAGATNTAAIVASCAEANTAAWIADNLALNGYDDWFLPSRDELELVWANLYRQGLGTFAYLYWSSSQTDATFAWAKRFDSNGYWSNYYKSDARAVRAIRAF